MDNFDWVGFLRARMIPYVTGGKNVARGRLGIRCPFCGPADPSQHMGIDPARGFWDCWRNKNHRGTRPGPLVAALTGLSPAAAAELVAKWATTSVLPPATLPALRDRLKALETPQRCNPRPQSLSPLPEFKPVTVKTPDFLRYLAEDRGFGGDAHAVAAYYGLHACYRGDWVGRLIIPLRGPGGKWCGWQGRATGNTDLRYITYPDGAAAKRTVWNYDRAIAGGKLLMVCEGPFDAMKLDWYGRGLGAHAVALLGVNPTAAQIEIARRLRELFYVKTVVCFDEDAGLAGFNFAAHINVFGTGPDCGYKDPGDMPPAQARDFVKKILARRA